jgi:2-polyprenyl-6-hydroxyphenyl methylase/3-demethylubiquinone-9 3-methyltransferase
MPIGSRLRDLLGPLEGPVSRWSRAAFFDVERFVQEIRAWCAASRIREIGCGVGHVTEFLARAYPDARVTGIDLSPRAGRLFVGDRRRVRFHQQSVQEFARGREGTFDLVVLSDVLHHVPLQERVALLCRAFDLLEPGGAFVLKDWEPSRTPIHLMAYLSDRYITGDRVQFERAVDYQHRLGQIAPAAVLEHEIRIPPWRNNFALLLRSGRIGQVKQDAAHA